MIAQRSLNTIMENGELTHLDFGPYRLDLKQHILLREGKAVPLTPKAFDTLFLLMTSGGLLLKKEELLKRLWPDTYVGEATLAQNIFVLRRALGSDARGQPYIETIPKIGYRFNAIVVKGCDDGAITRNSSNGEKARCSIAVMPLMNVSANSGTQEICAAITEEIVDALTLRPNLQVKAYSVVRNFVGIQVDPQTVGRELGVKVVLLGKVYSINECVRIRVELVDVVEGWQLWSGSYNEDVTKLKAIEENIVNNISVKLSAAESRG